MILKQKASKRLLSLFLAVMMCLMIMPTSALAASEVGLETEETQSEETIISSENDEAEATEEIADPEETLTVCNCGTDDMAIHAVGCPVYVTPENPECYCVEKCTEPNLWCDICGFDVTACEGGEDTAAVYQVGDTFEGFLHNTDNRIDYSVTYRFTILSDGTTPDVELTGIVKGTPTELILAGSTYASLATQDKNDLYKIVSIGEKAFYNCTTLTKVNLGNSKVTEVKQSAFEKCTALTSLNLAGVQTIGERAFSECGVTLLNGTALDGVQSIGDEAFNNCTALESLILHASVKEMGDTVFTGCSKLSSLTLRNGITTLGNATFAECSSLTFVSIPDSITVIPVFTFYGCNNLQFLILSESVTEIGLSAFDGCNLTTLTIPNSVQIIDYNAFSSNKNLTSVTIPAGVATVGGMAFSYCTSLTTVTVKSSETNFESSVFSNCSALTAVIFADGEAPTFVADGTNDTFPSQLHQLTVEDGTGDGMYAQGRSVTLTYTGEGDLLRWKVTSGDATINGNTLTMGSAHSTVIPILTSYTITYDANGGDSYWLPGNMTAKYGEQIVLPEKDSWMTKENADFQGWMIEGILYQPGDTYTVTGNVTVYAHWLSYFRLWFHTENEIGQIITMYAYEPDYQFTLPECDYAIYEKPEGKNFKAWLVGDVEYKAGETITLTKNAHVYPVWEDAVTGTVTFSPGDELATGSMDSITVEAGATITLPECGFTLNDDTGRFYGWKINGTNYKPGAEYLVTNDVTAEAIWNWGYYTITFDANGGAGSMEPMYTFEMDYHTITLPQCGFTPPEGYRFKGWQVDEYNVALPGRSWQFQYTTTVKAIWELDETVSVDIFWGAMEFTYSDGNWNPETHSYESGWTAVGNTVTVVNNGNVDVKATATYDYFIPSIANWGFEYIWNASEAILTPDGDNKQFTFVLSFVGKPNQYFENSTLGIVHIQISRTD